MFALIKLLTLFALLAAGSAQVAEKKWWETASFYQIYPRSFKDSNGDGVGDLNGITEQLPYLKEIGITATWLSPIFTSPMADFGYDIANFFEIDPIFGTMEDFRKLMKKANEIGIKIILDFVPNHSSDECEWFIKSAANSTMYKNFYVWHPGKVVDGERQPPTNWISVFRGSAWTWHEGRQAYYLHQFHSKQPDLNYRNVAVRTVMKDVLKYWLNEGIAGFRIDATPHIYEISADDDGNWPDEPRNELVSDPDDYTYLNHIYTTNQPETLDLMYEFRRTVDAVTEELGGDDRILMTEAYAPIEVIMQYYGNAESEGAQIPFNFELISNLDKSSNAYTYSLLINNWLDHMPKGRTANWVLGNHDKNRIGSRMGEVRIDLLNTLLLTLPGCSVTYMGEEIGMTDVWISWNDTVDPQACQSNPDVFESLSRDPCRTPFQWNDGSKAGFTSGNVTWLPVSDKYKSVNVKHERSAALSHLNVFKKLQVIRRETVMRHGDTVVKALNENILAIKRSLRGYRTVVVLLNIMDVAEVVNLHSAFNGLTNEMEYMLVTDKSPKRIGDRTNTKSISLLPMEAVVLRATS